MISNLTTTMGHDSHVNMHVLNSDALCKSRNHITFLYNINKVRKAILDSVCS